MNDINENITYGGRDLMAEAQEIPDIGVMQAELNYAWTLDRDTYGLTQWREDIRYARWSGQSNDGLKHREHMGAKALPYEGAPDSRILLADGIINLLVDDMYSAFYGARVKTTPVTAKKLDANKAAEWRAIISWMLNGPLRESLIDDVEFAAQLTNTLGWCVLHPSWKREKVMRMQTLTMPEIFNLATRTMEARMAQIPAAGGEAEGAGEDAAEGPQGELAEMLIQLPQMIMDPTLEAMAVESVRALFPDFSAAEARRVVRELRRDQKTAFPVEVDGPNVPTLRVLVPGQHIVIPPESTALPGEERWMAVRVFMSEATLRQRAQEEEWNPEFVERVVKTKGLSIDNKVSMEHAMDTAMKDIEVIYMYQRRNSGNGVPGMWCTVLSNFVNCAAGQEAKPEDYGYNRLVDFGHDQYPFIIQQTEVTGLRPMDARGVPETVMTQQNELKNSRDLTYIYQQLSVAPPLQKKGTQASKLPPGLSPMGIVNNVNGGEWAWFPPPPGNPEVAFKLMAEVRKEVEDHYGIERADTPASRGQKRKMRLIGRWLAKWGQAFWQLSVLAYKNLSTEELTEILGRPPLLDADTIAQQRLMFWFNIKALDSEWLDTLIDKIIQLLQIDTGNSIDRTKLVQLVMDYLDPMLGEEVSLDQAGASQQMFKEVRDEINSIMQGNKPMLRQNDPTAKMKMMFAQQIVQENPAYQLELTPKFPNGMTNPNFSQVKADNLKTYMQNLQHNYQEMVTSKMQGRLGVSDVGATPVASGMN